MLGNQTYLRRLIFLIIFLKMMDLSMTLIKMIFMQTYIIIKQSHLVSKYIIIFNIHLC